MEEHIKSRLRCGHRQIPRRPLQGRRVSVLAARQLVGRQSDAQRSLACKRPAAYQCNHPWCVTVGKHPMTGVYAKACTNLRQSWVPCAHMPKLTTQWHVRGLYLCLCHCSWTHCLQAQAIALLTALIEAQALISTKHAYAQCMPELPPLELGISAVRSSTL